MSERKCLSSQCGLSALKLDPEIGPGNACTLHMRYDGRVPLLTSNKSVAERAAVARTSIRAARQGIVR